MEEREGGAEAKARGKREATKMWCKKRWVSTKGAERGGGGGGGGAGESAVTSGRSHLSDRCLVRRH